MIQEEIIRRERLAQIRKDGVNPYPSAASRTHLTQQVLQDFENFLASKKTISLAGRIRTLRKHGGLTFLQLEDASGRMQVALHRDVIGADIYQNFHATADLGDFYSFTGTVFHTKKGEPTLDAASLTLLTKTLLPLPEKFHGLSDTEKRYRQRYLDLIANQSSRDLAKARSRIVQGVRNFLQNEGFMEVETPILQPIAGGASARPFITHHNALHHDFYLRVAPELYLKRLMVGGFEKIYEFARCFRNEGISPQHNPEFTQVELYWAYATVEDLMDHIERMLVQIVRDVHGGEEFTVGETTYRFTAPLPRVSFRDIVLEKSGIDLDALQTEDALRDAMKSAGMKDLDSMIGYGELADYLYKERVRPNIIQPTFVIDYPAAMKPLAKRQDNRPHYSASAQLLMNGLETWNAFNELNDPVEQEERFMEQEGFRERGSEDAQRIDIDYIAALKHGMPPTAGYGLGIDRLVMLLTGSPNLKEVILFPTLKPSDTVEDENESE